MLCVLVTIYVICYVCVMCVVIRYMLRYTLTLHALSLSLSAFISSNRTHVTHTSHITGDINCPVQLKTLSLSLNFSPKLKAPINVKSKRHFIQIQCTEHTSLSLSS